MRIGFDQDSNTSTGSGGSEAVSPSKVLPVASLVLGIVSWLGFLLLASIPAIIIGHIARSNIRREGRGMATVGLVLGYANVLTSVLAVAILALSSLS